MSSKTAATEYIMLDRGSMYDASLQEHKECQEEDTEQPLSGDRLAGGPGPPAIARARHIANQRGEDATCGTWAGRFQDASFYTSRDVSL